MESQKEALKGCCGVINGMLISFFGLVLLFVIIGLLKYVL